uniref:Phosphoserine phosphatase n=2 Tax=Lygus hesperus TaxID=30085 RepID=A0A0K8SR14_LYGHE
MTWLGRLNSRARCTDRPGLLLPAFVLPPSAATPIPARTFFLTTSSAATMCHTLLPRDATRPLLVRDPIPPSLNCPRSTCQNMDPRHLWKNADAVCFDVDSTVIREEGIDELAKFCGKGDEVAALTKKAMGGAMSFRESLSMRLGIIRPTMSQIQEFIRSHPPTLSNHVKELISILHRRGTDVYLISGGFRSLISPVALQLNIPLQNIYANKMKFFFNGDFAGFDESSLTSSNGGKGKVIAELKRNFGYSNLVMIGDGATDLEACPPADAFIGYGGNVVREEVKRNAKWFVTDFRELIDALN